MQNRAFDDAARVAGGALGTLTALRREVEDLVRHQLDRILARMDLVTCDEFEAVKEMAVTARTAQDRLEARIAELEVGARKEKCAPPEE